MATGNVAVRCEAVGKEYTLGRARDDHPTLRAAVSNAASRWLRGQRGGGTRPDRRFQALHDVSFEVRAGESVGIIGRNGAGKSTLLKILSRVTEPTVGRVTMRGRVGSLLEVGTGFHPELTGRDNIYLNGAILGMKKTEIDRKFDEIVAFSEVERFLSTPVKHYSSGMQVRLAFAVAAHLETEILIADEVLAVGDTAFQQKCLGKMESVARQGRTVLFVSHNLSAVRALCDRGILLQDGGICMDGTASEVVGAYLGSLETAAATDLLERQDRRGTGEVRLTRIEISASDHLGGPPATGRPLRLVFHLTERRPGISCSFTIYDELGQALTSFDSADVGPTDAVDPVAGATFSCEIDRCLLIPGQYRINAAITSNGELLDHVEAAAILHVDQGVVAGRRVSENARYGSIAIPHRWWTSE